MGSSLWPILLLLATIQLVHPRGGVHEKTSQKCFSPLQVLWSEEVSHSVFAAAPLVTDLDGDGDLDVLAASFDGNLHAHSASSGDRLAGSWPYSDPHSTFHTSPLLYDIDGNGKNDVLIVTSQGELTAISSDGQQMERYCRTMPKLAVQKDWYKKQLSADVSNIHDFILEDAAIDDQKYVKLDAHVLANPYIVDFDQDGFHNEMIVPVSYYIDPADYADQGDHVNGLAVSDWDNYLASSVIVFNLTSLNASKVFHLELSSKHQEYPGYLLASPTAVDLDGKNGDIELIVGSSAGRVHVIGYDGKSREGFPLVLDSVQSQVAVADLDRDGNIEMVVVDISGTVIAAKNDGQYLWEVQIVGSTFSTPRVSDMTRDAGLEVIITSDDGYVHMLSGTTGEYISGWPSKGSKSLFAPPLLTTMYKREDVAIITLGEDGHLHLWSGDGKCRQTVSLNEKSLVSLLADDLVIESPGLEILVATDDGTLMCLGILLSGDKFADAEVWEPGPGANWPAEIKSPNVFSYIYGSHDVAMMSNFKNISHYSSKSFTLPVLLTGDGVYGNEDMDAPYRVSIYLGRHLLKNETFSKSGIQYIDVLSPLRPIEGQLMVISENKYGQIAKDEHYVRFHKLWLVDIKYMLTFPMVALCTVLLFGFGFQRQDVLPVTMSGKAR